MSKALKTPGLVKGKGLDVSGTAKVRDSSLGPCLSTRPPEEMTGLGMVLAAMTDEGTSRRQSASEAHMSFKLPSSRAKGVMSVSPQTRRRTETQS